MTLQDVIDKTIIECLVRNKESRIKTATELDIPIRTLYNHLKRIAYYELSHPEKNREEQ